MERVSIVALMISGLLSLTAAEQGEPAVRIEPVPGEPQPALARVHAIRRVTDRDVSWTEGWLFTNITRRAFRFSPRARAQVESVTPLTPELAVYREGHTVTLTNTEIPTNADFRFSYGMAQFEVVFGRDGTNGRTVLSVPAAYQFERIPVRFDFKYETGSLAHNLYTNVMGRIAGKVPASGKPLLVFRNGWERWYENAVWNPDCWLNVPGKTSFSIGNYFDGQPAGYTPWSQGAGTLITPRHMVTAGHMCWPPFTNHWYRFLDTNNVVHERRIVAVLQCVDGATRKLWRPGTPLLGFPGVKEAGVDIALAQLDRDLPDSVIPAPFLSWSELQTYLPHFNPTTLEVALPAGAPPLLFAQMDQAKNAKIESLAGVSTLNREWHTGPGPAGNSGSPAYFLINNDLALFDGAWASRWVVTNLANLCYSNGLSPQRYQLRFYNLSGFKTYAREPGG